MFQPVCDMEVTRLKEVIIIPFDETSLSLVLAVTG